MKPQILLLAVLIAALSSCTTAYKTGQTPDDVYFSKSRQPDEYVRVDEEDDQYYRYDDEYYDDRYLRMKVRNRNRWSDLDDWYYNERRFRYNVYTGTCFCNDPWNPYNYWNSFYNPYYNSYYHTYGVGGFVTIKSPVYSKPRTFNLNTYTSNQPGGNTKTYGNYNYNPVRSGSNNNNTYTPTRNSSGTGSVLRNIFNGNNSSSGGTKVNTSSGSSGNNTNSGSGSGGGSAPVRRF